MAAVAQLVRAPDVAGSSPVGRPKYQENFMKYIVTVDCGGSELTGEMASWSSPVKIGDPVAIFQDKPGDKDTGKFYRSYTGPGFAGAPIGKVTIIKTT